MLSIIIPQNELYDEQTNEFKYTNEQIIELEHSLVSISKWESKWNKPFLESKKSDEETIDYIKCMTLTKNISDEIYLNLSSKNINEIKNYIDAPMTATTFYNKKEYTNREKITSDLIYYWMISLNIPMECQNWHINRLLTLIRICNIKNTPPKKMSRNDIISRNAALNKARREKLKTTG